MINKVMREKIFCGLDIGSQRLKVSLIQAKSPQSFQLLGVYETKTVGMNGSSVTDLAELSDCIHRALEELSHKTSVRFKNVQVGISGDLVRTRIARAVIPLLDKGNKVITAFDIKKVISQARLLGVKLDEEILHDCPQFFVVDDGNVTLNPQGLYGRKLEVTLLLVVADTLRLKNIMNAVNQAGYEINNRFFSSYAASGVAVSEDLKKRGCAFIDIGAQSTNILIFKDNLLKYHKCIASGGNDISRKIAQTIHLSFDLAEDIKRSYAVALKEQASDSEEILVKRDNGYMPIKRAVVCQSIESEIQSLVDKIYTSVVEANMIEHLNAGVIMIGGGSLLPGLLELIENKIKLPVSIGTVRIADKALSNAAIFSSAVGLAQDATLNMFDFAQFSQEKVHWTKGFINRIREMYHDYF